MSFTAVAWEGNTFSLVHSSENFCSTVTFGSEVWVVSGKDEELLNAFQSYAGKRVQRLPQRAPNVSSSYGLGWLKLTSFIRVKQMLFVRSILKMDPENVVRKFFEVRLKSFCKNVEVCRLNKFRSPIFNILSIAMVFGVLGPICSMVEGQVPLVSKKAWSDLIWARAWKLDDASWLASNSILNENDLLTRTIGETRYLTWWVISDYDYRLMQVCEDMSKIVSHASQLKRDDYRLKGLTMSARTCTNCDHFCIEDITHIVLQCPYFNEDRTMMYDGIFSNCPNAEKVFKEESANIIYYLLGKKIPSFEDEEMLRLWCISGSAISKMYRRVISNRTGVG